MKLIANRWLNVAIDREGALLCVWPFGPKTDMAAVGFYKRAYVWTRRGWRIWFRVFEAARRESCAPLRDGPRR